jgi:glycosyltransferase involved in cell wall biosynthesis
MHILLIHNRYQQTGGEDAVYAAERELLLRHGHTITEFLESNARIASMNRFSLAFQSLWSRPTYLSLQRLVRDRRPDVAYCINTFPLVSPSAYDACREQSIPIVQGLHNYRLLCPAANFFRAERVCTDCLGRTPPWPGVLHGCYHRSRTQTAVVAAMIAIHRGLRTWQKKVDAYIAPTEFLRGKFIEGGFAPERIHTKSNFLPQDPGARDTPDSQALFIGRLAPEKGIRTLLQAWQKLEHIPLQILGAGPLREEIQTEIRKRGPIKIELAGFVPREQVFADIKQARFLVFPSVCFESFGFSIIEAFACGVPVIASRLGAMAELVEDGRTGLLCAPGDPADLASKVEWAWAHPNEMAGMGAQARGEYEEKYTPEKNYKILMKIFDRAMNGRTAVE